MIKNSLPRMDNDWRQKIYMNKDGVFLEFILFSGRQQFKGVDGTKPKSWNCNLLEGGVSRSTRICIKDSKGVDGWERERALNSLYK